MGPNKLNGLHTNYKTRMWILAEYRSTHGALEINVDLYGKNETVYVTEKGPLVLTPDLRWRTLMYWNDFCSSEKKAMLHMVAKKNHAQRVLTEAAPQQLESDDRIINALRAMDQPQPEEDAAQEDQMSFWRKTEMEKAALRERVEAKLAEARWRSWEKKAQEDQEKAARAKAAQAAWVEEFRQAKERNPKKSASVR